MLICFVISNVRALRRGGRVLGRVYTPPRPIPEGFIPQKSLEPPHEEPHLERPRWVTHSCELDAADGLGKACAGDNSFTSHHHQSQKVSTPKRVQSLPTKSHTTSDHARPPIHVSSTRLERYYSPMTAAQLVDSGGFLAKPALLILFRR